MFLVSTLINKLRKIIFLVALGLLSTQVYAGGVALGATRVIYPLGEKQTSLSISNSDIKNRFLVQTWVEDAEGKKTDSFVITPPLFVLKPKTENTFRIIYAGQALPEDRETVFWLNSKAIPAIEEATLADRNVLQIATLTRIKLFVRPKGLASTPEDALKTLSFHKASNGVKVENPSPYYVSMVNIKMHEQVLKNTMIAPMSVGFINVEGQVAEQISYQTVNDYGALTEESVVTLR